MFKTDNRLFDDLAKAATGAVGALSGMRQQVRSEIKAHVNRLISEMDFVPRADFEIVESMVREARLQNQVLEKRIAALEAGAPRPAKKAVKPLTTSAAPAKKKKI